MDRCEKSLREKRSQHGRRNPSFSSSLLDAIYRSIDDECDSRGEGELILYQETTRKKHSSGSFNFHDEHKEMMSLRRSCQIEQWVKKAGIEKVHKASDFEAGFPRSHRDNMSTIFNSTSSSSESSFGGFSSSEAESMYSNRASVFTSQRPKPVRTGLGRSEKPPVLIQEKTQFNEFYMPSSIPKDHPQKTKQEGFMKSKSRAASKIYGELKKAKQPISPGGRLASFLNSIFAAGNAKKTKISASNVIEDMHLDRKSKSAQASTCSSASSYSRSCLSKRGRKADNGVKRSVRFYPVSVIVDEDCRPCGQKCLYEDGRNTIQKIGDYPPLIGEELKFHLMEKSKRVEEAAKDLLKGYQKKQDFLGEVMKEVHDEDDDDDDNEDAASCSSSDLFELENLAAIGMERYRDELPVYETTHLNTNRAIASGLIL